MQVPIVNCIIDKTLEIWRWPPHFRGKTGPKANIYTSSIWGGGVWSDHTSVLVQEMPEALFLWHLSCSPEQQGQTVGY